MTGWFWTRVFYRIALIARFFGFHYWGYQKFMALSGEADPDHTLWTPVLND